MWVVQTAAWCPRRSRTGGTTAVHFPDKQVNQGDKIPRRQVLNSLQHPDGLGPTNLMGSHDWGKDRVLGPTQQQLLRPDKTKEAASWGKMGKLGLICLIDIVVDQDLVFWLDFIKLLWWINVSLYYVIVNIITTDQCILQCHCVWVPFLRWPMTELIQWRRATHLTFSNVQKLKRWNFSDPSVLFKSSEIKTLKFLNV